MPQRILLKLTDFDFPYVRVTMDKSGILLEYGHHNLKAEADSNLEDPLTIDLSEHLDFDDYPEMAGLRDSLGWDLTELFCLFDQRGHYLMLQERLQRMLKYERQRRRRPLPDENTEAVYKFIVQHFDRYGWAPTIAEIGEACFLAQGSVVRALSLLEAHGYLHRDAGKVRAMRLLDVS